jgi:cation transport protein ChaC
LDGPNRDEIHSINSSSAARDAAIVSPAAALMRHDMVLASMAAQVWSAQVLSAQVWPAKVPLAGGLPPDRRLRYIKRAILPQAPDVNETDMTSGDLWVFGYGSLMWRPGFAFAERARARIIGAHRSLCVYSFVHRGTPERPGLVLGLDHGGACQGIAFRVAAADREATLTYLRAREQINMVYREVMRAIWLEEHEARRVSALCYVVDRAHPQYAGRLPVAEQLRLVRQGHGRSGDNRDYVLSTVAELEAQGCRDADLHRLAEMLRESG